MHASTSYPCAPHPACQEPRRRRRNVAASARKRTETGETSAPLKALWYAAEAFGDAVGLLKKQGERGEESAAGEAAPARLSSAERLESLRADYDENYFISGRGELRAYDEDCEFSDPFVAFRGKQRFLKNVANLGGLMENVKLDITRFEANDAELSTDWRFACTLALPWRPRLAASGGTTHVFSPETGLVVKHIERWDIEPGIVARQLFTPGEEVRPTSPAS